MRLDRFLTEMNMGSRSQVKKMLSQGLVTVNGKTVTKPETRIRETEDQIAFQGNVLRYQKYEYYMMNKPAGVLSATRDGKEKTALDLLPSDHRRDLSPAGRLDKDTEGFLFLTNDGELAHRLLSPKHHVSKTYLVRIAHELSPEDILRLENGIDLGEDGITLPAHVTVLREGQERAGRGESIRENQGTTSPEAGEGASFREEGVWIHLTIREGKFHQVKRMLHAVGNEVLYLKRIRFGALNLDPSLAPGEYRALTQEELESLRTSTERERDKKALIRGKKAVIFDLDGSLVDSMWLWADIDREYLGKFGIPLEDHKALQRKIEGMSFHQTALYFKENYEIPDDIDQMKETWNRMAWEKYEREVPLKCGIPDFLEGCVRQGIRLGIATSNSRELVENILRAHRLKEMFSCIRTGSEVLNGKPAPDIYLAVCEELNVAPEDCLVFEDILPGLMAGRAAGMTVCAVEDEYSADSREEKKAFADGYIEDYYDFF